MSNVYGPVVTDIRRFLVRFNTKIVNAYFWFKYPRTKARNWSLGKSEWQ